MRLWSVFLAVLFSIALAAPSAYGKDDLLETLAQKGVITMAEYEKLKAQRKTEVTMTTDDGFKFTSGDNSASIQIGTLQQFDLADYDEDNAKLSNGTDLRRSRLSIGGIFLTDWQYRVEYEFVGTSGITDAYVAYTRLKPFIVTAGQFKQPFGMEALAADKTTTFMERGLPFAFHHDACARVDDRVHPQRTGPQRPASSANRSAMRIRRPQATKVMAPLVA